jgi:hypothetical protein
MNAITSGTFHAGSGAGAADFEGCAGCAGCAGCDDAVVAAPIDIASIKRSAVFRTFDPVLFV